jgi:hypothetical protein
MLEQLVWRDRHGRLLQTVGDPGPPTRMNLSGDGSKLAQTIRDPATGEIGAAIRDLVRGTLSRLPVTSPFSSQPGAVALPPVWSPKGDQLVFLGRTGGGDVAGFRLKSLTEEPERLGFRNSPVDWSMDGSLLLLSDFPNLSVALLDGPQTTIPFVASASEGRFAPNLPGPPRWIAYTLWPGPDVHIEGFSVGKPASGAKWKISVSGGEQPRWRSDGKELYYRDGGRMMAVPVDISGPEFRSGPPVPLFEARPGADYVVTSDGLRFLLSESVANPQLSPAPPVTITLNWQAKLK